MDARGLPSHRGVRLGAGVPESAEEPLLKPFLTKIKRDRQVTLANPNRDPATLYYPATRNRNFSYTSRRTQQDALEHAQRE
jgi:hypothetical protein